MNYIECNQSQINCHFKKRKENLLLKRITRYLVNENKNEFSLPGTDLKTIFN